MWFRLTTLLILILWSAGCRPVTFAVGVSPGDRQLATTVVESEGRWNRDRVPMIDVSGMILNAPKPHLIQPGDNPVSLLHEKLEMARGDKRVRAVILRLNTPGGTVTASDAMYRQIERFKTRTDKPVVALMMDVTASGGYYLACAADKIVAYPTTVTGSIGVIMQTFSLKPALNRLGIQTTALTSGPNKDAGSPFSVLTPEQQAVLQSLVDDFYGRFRDVVRRSRPLIAADQFDELTDGRILSGDQAVKAGLVDQVGDLYDAFRRAKELAGIPRADMVLYHRPLHYVASPYASAPMPGGGPGGGTQINLAQFNFPHQFGDASIGFFYLWQPVAP